MCVQDVKLGRAKHVTSNQAAFLPNFLPQRFLAANPRRATLIVAAAIDPDTVPGSWTWIRSGGPTGAVIGILTGYHPICVMDVETYGTAGTGEIWIGGHASGGEEMNITELSWLEEVEEV